LFDAATRDQLLPQAVQLHIAARLHPMHRFGPEHASVNPPAGLFAGFGQGLHPPPAVPVAGKDRLALVACIRLAVGTSRCDVPARVQKRAERTAEQ